MPDPSSADIDPENAALLESALATAFQNPSASRRASATLTSEPISSISPSSQLVELSVQPSETASSTEAHDQWKEAQEGNLQRWREESASARAKAEQERARWEGIRAAERVAAGDSWIGLDKDSDIPGPPNPLFRQSASPASPSPADVRDSVSGEGRGGHGVEVLEAIIPPAKGTATPPEETVHPRSHLDESRQPSSHQWEEVPSMESSFPSMSFPERSVSPSPEPQPHPPTKALTQPTSASPSATPSATLSVFDRSLTKSTRAWALVSSLTINLFLPFVNGVMLGFGEIFARNILAKFGWTIPGGTATAIGVGVSTKRRQ